MLRTKQLPKAALALVLALAMLSALVACGGGGGGSATTTAAAQEQTQAATTQAAAVTTAAAADATTTAAATTTTAATAAAADAPLEEERELYHIEQFNTYANYMGMQAGWYGQMIKEKFNIEVNIIAPNVAGSGDMLYQTRSAAGNLGDSIIITRDRIVDCQSTGLLYDMTDMLADSPNLQKLSLAYEAFAKSFPDGRVWGIPGRISSYPIDKPGSLMNPSAAPYIRYDWYIDIGEPEIVGWDGFDEVLKQMVEAHPVGTTGEKTYAQSLFPDWDGESVRGAREMLFFEGYYPLFYPSYIWVNVNENTFLNLTEPDGLYYFHLKRLNKLYRQGLLDPDSATQNWDNIAQKFSTEQRIAFGWWSYLASSIFSAIDLSVRAPYAPVPITGMVINSPSYNPYGGESTGFAIGADAKYPERIMEWYEWQASPEGMLVHAGLVEGVTYEMVDGKPVRTDFARDPNPDKQAPAHMGGGTWNDGTCKQNWAFHQNDSPNELLNGAPANSSLWESTIEQNANEFNTHWKNKYGYDSPMDFYQAIGQMISTPSSSYQEPAQPSVIQTTRAQIKEQFQPAGWRMIYAETDAEFQNIWDEVLAKLPDFGLAELTEYDMGITMEYVDAINEARGGQ
ncbi:MAG: hypothetical protein FWH01_02730 [Oscillospiraceae bacterium]|nr:hypothetical protein [Oscillospiraceae bacterium]